MTKEDKVVELPEKLYVSDYGSEVRYYWHPKRLAVKDVEYIRKDLVDSMLEMSLYPSKKDIKKEIFIEKACQWLKSNITNNPNANSIMVRNGCVTLGMLIDDFKNYMKGE